jgi:hypothetical protein
MFNGLFGKGGKSGQKPPQDAVDTKGLEVVENDADTAWGLWDSALAEQDSRFSASVPTQLTPMQNKPVGLPTLPTLPPPAAVNSRDSVSGYMEIATEPIPLEQKPIAHRIEEALSMVDLHHQRVANTIRTIWGHKECVQYINKLVMGGSDDSGRSRVGFHQEAVNAMLELANLHEAQYGPVDNGPELGFRSGSTFR